MKYISNGFSPKMLNPNKELIFTIEDSSLKEIQDQKEELISSIGHDTIAEHVQIEKNRINIQLEAEDILYLVQIYHDKNQQQQYDYRKISITE